MWTHTVKVVQHAAQKETFQKSKGLGVYRNTSCGKSQVGNALKYTWCSVLFTFLVLVLLLFFFVIVPRGEPHPVKWPVGNHCIHCIHLEAASSFLVFVFVVLYYAFVLYIVGMVLYTLDFYLVYLATTLFRIAVPVLIPFPFPFPFKTRKIQARKGMILNLT